MSKSKKNKKNKKVVCYSFSGCEIGNMEEFENEIKKILKCQNKEV